jgi:hypothetical protein
MLPQCLRGISSCQLVPRYLELMGVAAQCQLILIPQAEALGFPEPAQARAYHLPLSSRQVYELAHEMCLRRRGFASDAV